MSHIQNLTLENFWNDLKKECPLAVDHFRKWIDEYKLEVGWADLFGAQVKFHHLPFEMQNGIIARYELELYNNLKGRGKEAYEKIAAGYPQDMRRIFYDLQAAIESKRIKMN
jgi:hypothetical protein